MKSHSGEPERVGKGPEAELQGESGSVPQGSQGGVLSDRIEGAQP